MSQRHFEPWRREGPTADPLAERVGQRWEALIRQSKEAVASLRQATADAEQMLQRRPHASPGEAPVGAVHERLNRRLDEFEARLERIEAALSRPLAPKDERPSQANAPEGPHPLTLPPQQHAA